MFLKNAHVQDHRSVGVKDHLTKGHAIVIQNVIGGKVQIEEENDLDRMKEKEIATAMKDATEIGDDQDHVIENGRDHVIENIENKPLPFQHMNKGSNTFNFRNEIQSSSSWRFQLVSRSTRKTSTATIMEQTNPRACLMIIDYHAGDNPVKLRNWS